MRAGAAEPALTDPGGAPVDLQLNFPVLPEQSALLATSLATMLRPDVLANALQAGGVTGTAPARAAAADLLARNGWRPEPERILFTGNGKQSLAATIAALAPDRTVLVDSLSKRIAPGLTLGFVVPPASLVDQVAAAVRGGGWTAPRFAVDVAAHHIADGTAAAVQLAKRADAAARQQLVADRLAGFTVHADPRTYHCWWELPQPWRADTFVAAAAREGIAVTPAAAFAVGAAPNAVRLALASPPLDRLKAALEVLAGIARAAPELGA